MNDNKEVDSGNLNIIPLTCILFGVVMALIGLWPVTILMLLLGVFLYKSATPFKEVVADEEATQTELATSGGAYLIIGIAAIVLIGVLIIGTLGFT